MTHSWFRFSSGNDRILVLKVQTTRQLNSPPITTKRRPWRLGILWKPAWLEAAGRLNGSWSPKSRRTGDRAGIQGGRLGNKPQLFSSSSVSLLRLSLLVCEMGAGGCWAQGTMHVAVHGSPGLPALRSGCARKAPRAGMGGVNPCPRRGPCRQQSHTPPPASSTPASTSRPAHRALQATCSHLGLHEPPRPVPSSCLWMWGWWVSGPGSLTGTRAPGHSRPFPSPASIRKHRPRAWPGQLETQGHPQSLPSGSPSSGREASVRGRQGKPEHTLV